MSNYTILGIYTPAWAEDGHNCLFVHARTSSTFYVFYCLFVVTIFSLVIAENFNNTPLFYRESLFYLFSKFTLLAIQSVSLEFVLDIDPIEKFFQFTSEFSVVYPSFDVLFIAILN